jgi:predicted negative regulator of RcsB-dependent stress response
MAHQMAEQSMDKSIDNSPIDLGVACLERAIRRMQEQNHAAAVADLRAALRYMQHNGSDPLQAQHLASIITDAEQHLAFAS